MGPRAWSSVCFSALKSTPMGGRAKTIRRGSAWLWPDLSDHWRGPRRAWSARLTYSRNSPILGSGAVLRNRDGYVERLEKGPSRVDLGASFLETVQERPSGGGEGGVEFVARILSRDLEDDGRSLCCLRVKMLGQRAARRGWRQWRRLTTFGVNTHHMMSPGAGLAIFRVGWLSPKPLRKCYSYSCERLKRGHQVMGGAKSRSAKYEVFLTPSLGPPFCAAQTLTSAAYRLPQKFLLENQNPCSVPSSE